MDYTNLIDKVNIPELVEALRYCGTHFICEDDCPRYHPTNEYVDNCRQRLSNDAAAAIEELEKELEIWTARSFEGKIGSMALTNLNLRIEISKLEAQMPKRGEWIRIDKHTVQCSLCHRYLDLRGVNAGRGDANYCPSCGAKMEAQE